MLLAAAAEAGWWPFSWPREAAIALASCSSSSICASDDVNRRQETLHWVLSVAQEGLMQTLPGFEVFELLQAEEP